MLSGPLQIGNQEVGENSSIQHHRLGQLAVTADGRKFRYAKNGAATGVAGNLYVAMDVVANDSGLAVATSAVAGATKVQVTLGGTAHTADQYKDGYLTVNTGTNEGYTYQIRGNQAQSSTSGTAWVYLYDPLETALTAGDEEVTLNYSPWALVLISTASGQADMPVGIMHTPLTINYYGWLQTGGMAPVEGDETFGVGDDLTIGSSVAGSLEMLDAAGEPLVGTSLVAGIDGEFTLAYLKMD